jgi:hypothetical protein
MIGFLLMMLILVPERWSIWQKPIVTPSVCFNDYQHDLTRCAVRYPDAASLQREVCEADARGRYTACMEGW